MRATSITFFAAGNPRPQGSKRAFVIGGKARLVEMVKGVKPWREVVRVEALAAMKRAQSLPFQGPVCVWLEFVMPRPKRPSKPLCDVKPDLDKLTRAVFDGLTGAVFSDDSAVVLLRASKRFARPSGIEKPGALIRIEAYDQGVEVGPRVPADPSLNPIVGAM